MTPEPTVSLYIGWGSGIKKEEEKNIRKSVENFVSYEP